MITRRVAISIIAASRCLIADPQRNPGLVGMYFNMPANLKEPPFSDLAPAVVRVDRKIAFDWKRQPPSPRVGRANFSVRWQGLIYLPASGVYTLRLSHDSGLRVQIGGELVYSYWRGRRNQFLADHKFTQPGWAQIQIQYHALRTRAPHLCLDWATPGSQDMVTIPESAFAHVGAKTVAGR